MKRILLIALAIPLSGCGLELLGATAIGTGMQADNARRATSTLQMVQDKTSMMGVEQAISAYRAEKGEYPPDFDTLVRAGYLSEAPLQEDGTPYGIDQRTGAITTGPAVTSAPVGNPAADSATLKDVEGAVARYWRDNKTYPPSLDALTPKYLTQLPRSSTGGQFGYDPRTGRVYPPRGGMGASNAPAASSPAPARRGGGIATTPFGDAMTGMGVQQELNSMGHSGVNSAGSRMRGRGGSIPDDHTARQMQAMDNLGL